MCCRPPTLVLQRDHELWLPRGAAAWQSGYLSPWPPGDGVTSGHPHGLLPHRGCCRQSTSPAWHLGQRSHWAPRADARPSPGPHGSKGSDRRAHRGEDPSTAPPLPPTSGSGTAGRFAPDLLLPPSFQGKGPGTLEVSCSPPPHQPRHPPNSPLGATRASSQCLLPARPLHRGDRSLKPQRHLPPCPEGQRCPALGRLDTGPESVVRILAASALVLWLPSAWGWGSQAAPQGWVGLTGAGSQGLPLVPGFSGTLPSSPGSHKTQTTCSTPSMAVPTCYRPRPLLLLSTE